MGSCESEDMEYLHHPEIEHPTVHGGSCPIETYKQAPLTGMPTNIFKHTRTPTIEVPVVLAEPTLQIVLKADIKLHPAATEIKGVKNNVFLDQVKLIPVSLTCIDNTDFFNVIGAKVFVAGHIRKNIEYATNDCQGIL